jgi:RNA polymerase sigma-70 factor (ECF subfamily)
MSASIGIKSKAEAFEEIALKHMDSVYRYALFNTKNESDAEDLVQDTYVRAYRFFDKFEKGSNCRAWLLKILRNTFINSIRREEKSPIKAYISEIEYRGAVLPGGDNPGDEVFGDLLDDDVVAAVNSLIAQYKTAVLLADVEGLSYKEISDIVGCPIGTVMSRIHRGRKLLRKKLQAYAVQRGYVAVGSEAG